MFRCLSASAHAFSSCIWCASSAAQPSRASVSINALWSYLFPLMRALILSSVWSQFYTQCRRDAGNIASAVSGSAVWNCVFNNSEEFRIDSQQDAIVAAISCDFDVVLNYTTPHLRDILPDILHYTARFLHRRPHKQPEDKAPIERVASSKRRVKVTVSNVYTT